MKLRKKTAILSVAALLAACHHPAVTETSEPVVDWPPGGGAKSGMLRQPVAEPRESVEAAPIKPSVVERTTVILEENICYRDFAALFGTTPETLNELNGLNLDPDTVLAKGSELYVPRQQALL